MTAKAPTHRVICADHTHETFSLEQAERHRAGVERLGHCQLPHVIELRVDGRWVPQHLVRAREILAAPIGTVLQTPDGPLIKASGGWSKETGDRADAVADPATDLGRWRAALGPHEDAILTADRPGGRLDSWCTCRPRPQLESWIRYEHWTTVGRVGHGYLCPVCRAITQTG
jgi:hypothetical protein